MRKLLALPLLLGTLGILPSQAAPLNAAICRESAGQPLTALEASYGPGTLIQLEDGTTGYRYNAQGGQCFVLMQNDRIARALFIPAKN